MTVDYIVGDTRDVTATIPDGSVSLVACSPPFIALRSYLPADHPDKDKEIGSEPDPATFLDTLLGLTAEWGRVLAPWGSIAIELGDTYADSGANVLPKRGEGNSAIMGETGVGRSRPCGSAWPMAKSLALVPQLYAASLAYGRNILTGQPSPAGQWRVRNMIVWHRPNPAVGALGDKYRPCTSYITVATRDSKRWFDLTAVRTQHKTSPDERRPQTPTQRTVADIEQRETGCNIGGATGVNGFTNEGNPAGAPPLDCWFDEWDGSHDTWTQTTQPSSLAHYAMWPAKLAERLILSMCPAEVCTFCREPRRRIEQAHEWDHKTHPLELTGVQRGGLGTHGDRVATPTTLGWSVCGCGVPFTPGTVLDPFAGTFTTGLVAEYHGRNAIGIDLDPRNADLVPLRREEVRRNLNPTHVRTIDGQLDMFSEGAA